MNRNSNCFPVRIVLIRHAANFPSFILFDSVAPRRVFHSIDLTKAATHYPGDSPDLKDKRLEGAVHNFLKTNVN